MFKALAFSALLAGCAAVIKENVAFSDGIKAVKSMSAKSDRVWMSFPEQLAFHKDAVNGQVTWTESDIVREDTFWEVRGAALGLESGNTMKLVRSFTERSTQITFKTYQQSVQDIRVFGGEFVLAVGLHGGVLRANGLPLMVNTIASNLRLPDTTIGAFAALDEMKVYVREKVKSSTAEITELAPLQLVWHLSQAGNGKMGVVSKAYWVNGLSSTNHAFDIFVDAMGGGVLQYIDKSRKASPFSSPLPGDVKVYDQSAGNTLVFSTTASPPPTYPTTDQEMNTLIDNTYYVKYYFQSISGGTFITWRGYESELKITYNLEIANAYFDGYSGIFFGTGYITDDVISHEWAHGYTDSTNGLIYAYQSGALNEAYSDMHGESIDILNADTPDTVTLRTEYPLTCTVYLDSDLNVPAGTDNTKRWELGEEVDTDATSTDESLRDMYYPECFINPGSVFSDAFVCTTSDEGGVHTNSGVPNRLYAVIVDGGEYEDPSNPSQRISVTGLGLTKATNLIWRAQLELTPSSQFSDWGTALQEACTASINSDIYVPNLLSGSTTPVVSSSSITAADCTNVNNAIIGSGIMDDSDWCPNMECSSSTACTFSTCPANTMSAKYETFHFDEDYNYMIGCSVSRDNYFARVFTQDQLSANFSVACVEFALLVNTFSRDITAYVYLDSDGGAPQDADFTLLGTLTGTLYNSAGGASMVTVSGSVDVKFSSPDETLVVVVLVPGSSEGYLVATGETNSNVDTISTTYWKGPACGVSQYVAFSGIYGGTPDYSQFYVKLTTGTYTGGGDDSSSSTSLSAGEAAGVAIAVIVIVGIAGAVIYWCFCRGSKQAMAKSEKTIDAI